MFTIDQIKAAHSKVKSGADFPSYISDIKALGVSRYLTYVSDGHTEYFDKDNKTTASPARYEAKSIALQANAKQLKSDLKVHQAGETDYPTFCQQAADNGVNAWEVDTVAMTCTYLDIQGGEMVVEVIPKV
ncbi:MAG: DUF1398 family protein [Bacteroidota bacterium]